MNIQAAKTIALVDVLETLGYKPTHTTNGGNQVWYCSPLRTEKTASFTVKVSDNCWKDFGGSGGNILDFIMEYQQTNVQGALVFLDGLSILPAQKTIRQVRRTNKDTTLILNKVQPLTYPVLLQQLRAKGIAVDVAQLYLSEAYYTNGGKNYFGYAMANDRGGYEIHNALFKSGILKSPTTLKGKDSTRVTIFEGMTDFLSALQYHQILAFQTDTIILHSLAFCTQVIAQVQQSNSYQTAFMYLDNDRAGKDALARFSTELSDMMTIKPMNDFYADYKDVNAFWKAYLGIQ